MADFLIKITTDPTGAVTGAREVSRELGQVGKSGEDANKKIAKEAKEAAKSKSELKNVINQLTREFPMLGAAARLAVNPVVAAATLAGMAFSFAQDQIKKFEESLIDTAWGSYAKKAGIAAVEVEKVASAAKEAEAASARLADVFRAQQSAEEKLANARKGLDVAQAQGEKDPVKRAERLLEIESRYALMEYERAEKARQFKLSNQEDRAQDLKARGGRLAAEEQQWLGVSRTVGTPEEAKAELEKWKKDQAGIKADRTKAEVQAEKYVSGGWDPTSFQGRQAIAQMESLRRQEAQIGGVVQDRERQVVWAERAQRRIEEIRRQRGEVEQSAEGIEAMLPTQRAVAGIESTAGRRAMGIEGQTRLQTAANQAEGEHKRVVEEAARAIEAGKSVNGELISLMYAWRAEVEQLKGQVANLRNR